MEVKAYWKIIPCAFPIQEYLYNVQEWRSVDGGETYCYCGIGKFCKTILDCCEYIEQAKNRLLEQNEKVKRGKK